MPQSVLVIDDDPQICELLTAVLAKNGFDVASAGTLGAARYAAQNYRYDAMIIDQIMPDGRGLEFAAQMRDLTDAALLILTGRTDEVDRILALELAADDYITKPFHNRELLARLRAVLRRTAPHQAVTHEQTPVLLGEYTIDFGARLVRDGSGHEIPLTTREFDVLAVLARHTHAVLDRDRIIELAGWRKAPSQARTIDGLIRRLRVKLKLEGPVPLRIRTIHGRGYMLVT